VTSDPHATPFDAPDITLIEDPRAVPPALADLDLPVVGVDVERADADRYFRHAALVQVGGPGRCILLDGMVLDDLSDLDAYLSTRLTVLHAASNDVVPLAAKGVRPARLVDTAVAASVLGLPIGLEALLTEELGLTISGDKESFQRADWARRPIPDPMRAYAAGDVIHLPALWDRLATKLDATGRFPWFEQELAAALENAVTDTRDWRRVRGVGRLGAIQQLIARALWMTREELARAHDIAPNLLLHDEVIVAFAIDPPRTPAQLTRRARRRRRLEDEHAAKLLAAINAAEESEPPAPDPNRRRWTDADTRAFDRMREARAAVATKLGIDAGLLGPSKLLKEAVRQDPQNAAELCTCAGLRPWQRELLEDVLWRAYRGRTPRRARDESEVPTGLAAD
jgi:ribonuclease D